MRPALAALALVPWLAGCGVEPPHGNHTLRVHNHSVAGGACKARRFDYGWVGSADGTVAVWEHKFYARPVETVDVPVTVPGAGTYLVRLYAQQLPGVEAVMEVRWADVAMAPGGVTEVHMVVDEAGWLGSTCQGQPAAAATVTCT
jgi:hypothetical protein